MAICSYHSTGTTTCVAHRPSCSTNRPLKSPTDVGTLGKPITAADIEDLRSKIRLELARWGEKYGPYTYLQESAIIAGTVIPAKTPTELDKMVGQVLGTPSTVVAGDKITATTWQNIRARYDQLRQNCICNADCACNAVCACYGNCGCNYSDRRLKTGIQYC